MVISVFSLLFCCLLFARINSENSNEEFPVSKIITAVVKLHDRNPEPLSKANEEKNQLIGSNSKSLRSLENYVPGYSTSKYYNSTDCTGVPTSAVNFYTGGCKPAHTGYIKTLIDTSNFKYIGIIC